MEQDTVNTIRAEGALPLSTPNEEKVDVNENAIAVKMTEQEFDQAVTNQISDSNSTWEKLKIPGRQKIMAKYYIGDQVDKSSLRDDEEKGVENAIWRNMETFIPIATSRTPELSVTAAFKNPQTRQFAMDFKRVAMSEWEVHMGMQQQISRGIRNHQQNLLGVLQLGYDPDEDRFWCEEVIVTDLIISKNGDFIARYRKDKNLGYILDKFPNKKVEILQALGYQADSEVTGKLRSSPVEFLEAWTNEVVGWRLKNVVLGVKNNPHFDYKGVMFDTGQPDVDPATGQPKVDEQGAPVTKKTKVFYNHFKKPKMPFLFMQYINNGVYIYDLTTIIEQAIGPQDWINKRKRQIGLNADSTNGHWVSSGDYISQEEFDKLEGGITEKIWLENGLPADGLKLLTGEALPDYIYNDLVDSRSALDNLMGTHSTTRGEQSNNATLGQDLLQKDQDYGRVDGYVRDCIEVVAQKFYEYLYHLYLVYRTEDTSVAIPEDSDYEADNVVFSRDRVPLIQMKNGDLIPVPLVLKVKQGSTLPMDEVSEYTKAKGMKDILSPIDYFKMVGEPNPRELAKNFLLWTNDPFSLFKGDPDIEAFLQKQQAEAAAQAQAAAQEAAAKQGHEVNLKQMDIASKGVPVPPGADGVIPNGEAPSGGEDGGVSADGVANAMRDMINKGEVDPKAVAGALGQ